MGIMFDIHKPVKRDDGATVTRHTSNINRVSEMQAWCEENCTEYFSLHYYGPSKVAIEFLSEEDAILFALTWSN